VPLNASIIYDHLVVWNKNMTESGISMSAVTEGYVIRQFSNSTTGQHRIMTWDATTGDLVANGTWAGFWQSSGRNPVFGSGVYSWHGADGRTYAISFETGELAWVSEQHDMPWGNFGTYKGSAGFGVVTAGSYDGHRYAYNSTDGTTMWKQFTGTDNPYNYEYASNAPTCWGEAITADPMRPKVYWASGEHTPAIPHPRGDMLYCNDLMTGELLWRLPYFASGRAFWGSGVADGYLWYYNQLDGSVYMFGRGVTKTTLSAPSNAVPQGDPVLIQGRVLDLSPGTETLEDRFPDGVPAVADDGMSTWMAYLYTLGTTGPLVDLDDVNGVPVNIKVIHPNGNEEWITTVTTDSLGNYEYMYVPPTKGAYKIIAEFAGSGSYWSSTAEAAVGVKETPAAPTYLGPSANEVAQATINMLPAYPTYPGYQGPSATEIATATINRLPAYPGYQGPSANDVAQATINMLPAYPDVPTATEVAQETVNQMPDAPDTPAFLTIDLAILIVAAIGLVIGLLVYMAVRKQ
jgi:outer membrane protein assembly factor BamB